MSEIYSKVCKLVADDRWLPSTHALQRLAERQILIGDILHGLPFAAVVEEYPDDRAGNRYWSCCLMARICQFMLFGVFPLQTAIS